VIPRVRLEAARKKATGQAQAPFRHGGGRRRGERLGKVLQDLRRATERRLRVDHPWSGFSILKQHAPVLALHGSLFEAVRQYARHRPAAF
jgi:hypothetical protein